QVTKAFRRLKRTFCSRQEKKIDQVKQLSIGNKFIFFINIVVAIFLLMACAGPIVPAHIFPFLPFLSISVPVLILINLLFLGYWLFSRKKQFLLSFCTLIIGYFFLDSFFYLNFSTARILDEDLSIMSYNTNFFNNYYRNDTTVGERIVTFVKDNDPDILCFQEFSETGVNKFKYYPFKYVTPFSRERSIQAIYTKYPIIANGSLDFPNTGNNAIYADIVIKKDTIRVYNVHLQSLKIRPGSFKRETPQRLFKRLGDSFIKQRQQAELIIAHSKDSPYRQIICADMNNTQYSNVFHEIKGDMLDTFKEKGKGYGSTYIFKFLPIRIDFILMDKSIEIKAHRNFDEKLSDHYAIMASFRLKE
ncbi:MAG: endonuclease/exonuclease/phosphatase family protein, partial [Maribacter sp.]